MINFAEGWSPSETKYKITKSDLKKLVKAGADRIGTSNAISIINE